MEWSGIEIYKLKLSKNWISSIKYKNFMDKVNLIVKNMFMPYKFYSSYKTNNRLLNSKLLVYKNSSEDWGHNSSTLGRYLPYLQPILHSIWFLRLPGVISQCRGVTPEHSQVDNINKTNKIIWKIKIIMQMTTSFY